MSLLGKRKQDQDCWLWCGQDVLVIISCNASYGYNASPLGLGIIYQTYRRAGCITYQHISTLRTLYYNNATKILVYSMIAITWSGYLRLLSYSELSCGSVTVRVSSFEQSSPALHLQNTVHSNLVRQQLYLIVLHRLVPSEQLHQIRDIISPGARTTQAGTVTGSKDFDGSCFR